MATTMPRFAPATITAMRELLLVRDLSDMLDRDDPSSDADGAPALMSIQQVEERHWEVEQ
jgi:hypothetical protein